MSRIRRIAPGLGRGGLIGNTEGPESYLRELDTLPSQFCRATGGTETVIEEGDEAVSLLLNFDGSNGSTTFTDQSIYAHTVTANGNAQISTTESKFGGSSAALLATADTLSLSPGEQFAYGTEDFTVECWFYLNSNDSFGNHLFAQTATGVNYFSFRAGFNSPLQQKLTFVSGSTVLVHQSEYSLNQWHHAAVVRSNGIVHLYFDGVQSTSSAAVSTDFTNTTYVPTIGAFSHSTGSAKFKGYIDALRVVKGKALYTGNFTPPASAPTNKTGKYYRVHTFTDTDPTSLLLNFDGSNGSTTFTDDSGWGHAVTANGDAQISTTESKFGGSSGYFDGTGDQLKIASVSALAFGTGAFTAEFFFRLDTIVNAYQNFLDTDVSGGFSLYYNGPDGYFGGANSFRISNRVVNLITQSQALSTGVWYHLAVSRSSGTLRLFLDGTQIASVADTTNFAQGDFYIGGANGYIDSLRITKGQALYTSAFTPPTTALTRVGSGSLTFTRGGAVEYLVVGGGGGGGRSNGGGGGAGGFRTGSGKSAVAGIDYSVSVGGGGAGGTSVSGRGVSGSDSVFIDIESAGGGAGGGYNGSSVVTPLSGGSGGGGAGSNPGSAGAAGNTPSTVPSQGNSGGDGNLSGGPPAYAAGGGGGASAVGGNANNASPYLGGDGGAGTTSTISGSSSAYAGGGGGAISTGTQGSGGVGGGGAAGVTDGTSGTVNTGGGGGGGGATGGSGGSGIVIARYRITQAEYEAEAA